MIDFVRYCRAQQHSSDIAHLSEAFRSTSQAVFSILQLDIQAAFQAQSHEQIRLRDLAARASHWRDSQPRFDEWRRLVAADEAVRRLSASSVADALAAGRVAPKDAIAVLECTFAEVAWSKAVHASPELGSFHGPSHDGIANRFRALEAGRRQTTVNVVLGRHAEGMPRGNFGAMNTIRAEIKRRRGHMPIRKLFKTTGETLQRIKPVLLMKSYLGCAVRSPKLGRIRSSCH